MIKTNENHFAKKKHFSKYTFITVDIKLLTLNFPFYSMHVFDFLNSRSIFNRTNFLSFWIQNTNTHNFPFRNFSFFLLLKKTIHFCDLQKNIQTFLNPQFFFRDNFTFKKQTNQLTRWSKCNSNTVVHVHKLDYFETRTNKVYRKII